MFHELLFLQITLKKILKNIHAAKKPHLVTMLIRNISDFALD